VEDIGHEMGHNLGFGHSSTDTNNDGVIDSEYGDESDIMSYAGIGMHGLNAVHKDRALWVPESSIVTLTSTTTLTLSPLELTNATNPQVARVFVGGGILYFSCRQAIFYDSPSLASSFVQVLNIHRYLPTIDEHSLLLTTLGDGQSFVPDVGLNVTQLSHNGYDVHVLFDFIDGCLATDPDILVDSSSDCALVTGTTVQVDIPISMTSTYCKAQNIIIHYNTTMPATGFPDRAVTLNGYTTSNITISMTFPTVSITSYIYGSIWVIDAVSNKILLSSYFYASLINPATYTVTAPSLTVDVHPNGVHLSATSLYQSTQAFECQTTLFLNIYRDGQFIGTANVSPIYPYSVDYYDCFPASSKNNSHTYYAISEIDWNSQFHNRSNTQSNIVSSFSVTNTTILSICQATTSSTASSSSVSVSTSANSGRVSESGRLVPQMTAISVLAALALFPLFIFSKGQ